MSRVRDVLTVRGRAFVAAGLTLVLCGVALGFPDITRIGVLLTGLPMLAALGMHRSAPTVTVTRAVHPARVTVDQNAAVDDRLRQHLAAAHPGAAGRGEARLRPR